MPLVEPLSGTIGEELRLRAEGHGENSVLLAPGLSPLAYGELGHLARNTVVALNRFGFGRGDRIAAVLPNGPELASLFISVGCGATFAPLNPVYRAEELRFYLSDLRAKALIVPAGETSAATEAAQELGVPLLELVTEPGRPAGWFALQGEPARPPASPGYATAEEAALALHTSGTTAKPKLVPLSHRNLLASAAAIARTLALAPTDRCLNVMPLFHIHGLVGAVLSSIWAGGQIVATPGFQPLRFFSWLEEFQPTWYTAVPTMHQAILARAAKHRDLARSARLRFIRSSSAALPPVVLRELEEVFAAPVIESYGMTEASHQMASNPLPPSVRKPGSVGPAAGPDIAILDDDGAALPAGATGEVAIRGPNVTGGYADNPEANAKAFTNGWFRTGDQGYLDAGGYLFLTGRLKEIINRGGEKISPREIDEALLEHPAVAQAVAFAVPHEKLGEEIGAAVVLAEGYELSERELRDYLAERLAPFKTPRTILFLPEIPKGPTGKVQRVGLAERLGVA